MLQVAKRAESLMSVRGTSLMFVRIVTGPSREELWTLSVIGARGCAGQLSETSVSGAETLVLRDD